MILCSEELLLICHVSFGFIFLLNGTYVGQGSRIWVQLGCSNADFYVMSNSY